MVTKCNIKCLAYYFLLPYSTFTDRFKEEKRTKETDWTKASVGAMGDILWYLQFKIGLLTSDGSLNNALTREIVWDLVLQTVKNNGFYC
uniref:Uncharacterized protein n=1 Tax=Arion vulgaris TaxID=1028688 RepID=A0A0B7BGC8_9EUPU